MPRRSDGLSVPRFEDRRHAVTYNGPGRRNLAAAAVTLPPETIPGFPTAATITFRRDSLPSGSRNAYLVSCPLHLQLPHNRDDYDYEEFDTLVSGIERYNGVLSGMILSVAMFLAAGMDLREEHVRRICEQIFSTLRSEFPY